MSVSSMRVEKLEYCVNVFPTFFHKKLYVYGSRDLDY